MPKGSARPHVEMAVIEGHLRTAMEQEIGVAIPTSSPNSYRNMAYELMNEFPELKVLAMFVPAKGGEVFICKKEVSLNDL